MFCEDLTVLGELEGRFRTFTISSYEGKSIHDLFFRLAHEFGLPSEPFVHRVYQEGVLVKASKQSKLADMILRDNPLSGLGKPVLRLLLKHQETSGQKDYPHMVSPLEEAGVRVQPGEAMDELSPGGRPSEPSPMASSIPGMGLAGDTEEQQRISQMVRELDQLLVEMRRQGYLIRPDGTVEGTSGGEPRKRIEILTFADRAMKLTMGWDALSLSHHGPTSQVRRIRQENIKVCLLLTESLDHLAQGLSQ